MENLPKKITLSQCKDSGLALVLIALITFFFTDEYIFFVFGIIFLLLSMTVPTLFKTFAKFWFFLSNFFGIISTKIILTTLFFVLVTPVGLIRRCFFENTMQLDKWKKNKDSVFNSRNHVFDRRDLENPY